MYNFNKKYNMIVEDIIKSVSPEELEDRQKEYHKILLKKYFDKMIEDGDMVKNLDGTYDIIINVDLNGMELTSLENLPYKLNIINGYFDCSWNKLTDLKGCPKIIKGAFDCSNNKLTSLEGSPEIVTGQFDCSYNKLTNLKGCPTTLKDDIECSDNKLTSLEGRPNIIHGTLYCDTNNLNDESLKTFPKMIKGDLWLNSMKNEFYFNEHDIRKVCKVKGEINI